jgi:hypothetical protein
MRTPSTSTASPIGAARRDGAIDRIQDRRTTRGDVDRDPLHEPDERRGRRGHRPRATVSDDGESRSTRLTGTSPSSFHLRAELVRRARHGGLRPHDHLGRRTTTTSRCSSPTSRPTRDTSVAPPRRARAPRHARRRRRRRAHAAWSENGAIIVCTAAHRRTRSQGGESLERRQGDLADGRRRGLIRHRLPACPRPECGDSSVCSAASSSSPVARTRRGRQARSHVARCTGDPVLTQAPPTTGPPDVPSRAASHRRPAAGVLPCRGTSLTVPSTATATPAGSSHRVGAVPAGRHRPRRSAGRS